ncbi:MAG: hypothetical protein KME26_29745 [Oscillatoria princeps RMCB-10]|nr:hypothetical protein [Oscillatoria princeps RMCB-10]
MATKIIYSPLSAGGITGISRRLQATLYAGTFSHNTKIAQAAGFCQPFRKKIFRLFLSLSLALLHGAGSFQSHR